MSSPVLRIRPIAASDDAAMAAVIRTVMPTFGASGPGFAINDPEVDFMSRAYDRPGALYFVVEAVEAVEEFPGGGGGGGPPHVLGGGGLAPLDGAPAADRVCELRKMYFLPAARGHGIGARLLETCLSRARDLGYRTMYLETLAGMTRAVHLYERFGFQRLTAPMGHTGHFSCDRYYARSLEIIGDPEAPNGAPDAT